MEKTRREQTGMEGGCVGGQGHTWDVAPWMDGWNDRLRHCYVNYSECNGLCMRAFSTQM